MEKTDTEIIKKLYVDLCESSIKKDIERINELLSDDYILIHMTGMKQSKSDYINSVISGELKYYDAIHESIEVKLDNDIAYIIGKTKTLASPFGMNKSWWRLKQEMVVKKENEKWTIISSKASMY